jgi:hypothetical protein
MRKMGEVPAGAPAEDQAKLQAELPAAVGDAQRIILVLLLGSPSAVILVLLGAALSVHLKEMLGNPTSRFIPGLQRVHLTLAAVVAGIFTVAFPLAVSFGLNGGGSPITIVVWALAMFAVPAFVIHWLPNAMPALLIAMALLGFGALRAETRGSQWLPSAAMALPLLVVSIGCLASVATRLGHLNEEMFEYNRRMQTMGGQARSPWPFFLSHKMRFRRNHRLTSQETLISRARHWHAAWRTIWMAVAFGVFMGVLTGVLACAIK